MIKNKVQFRKDRYAPTMKALYRQKYGARKVGGYDSKKEFHRALALKQLAKWGDITELKEQVWYELIPEQRDAEGHLVERAMYYVADFTYKDKDGNLVVEDVKGYRTKEYIIKRKLMLERYGIKITEV
jgi:hypothetical protein